MWERSLLYVEQLTQREADEEIERLKKELVVQPSNKVEAEIGRIEELVEKERKENEDKTKKGEPIIPIPKIREEEMDIPGQEIIAGTGRYAAQVVRGERDDSESERQLIEILKARFFTLKEAKNKL